ncbi:hypothetical protein CC80DRAFT_589144 [Byssothecium circinans]|uniref:Uncharacterized protein n=1 Tax=Byssothecium circinans TaxID=147558 RepID=A0A6A5UBA2_9PLEO|nr:hypothetical protein CC80DRAFT_589144 [Byssothecium circinans]
MESAHLTKAHEHVRNAVTATYGKSIATAGEEHESAASAFHEATQDTSNSEALRILSLLEDHHHKLAGLIKEPPRKREKKKDTTQTSESSTTSPSSKSSTTRTSSPASSTRAPSRRRLPQSSIATNLAEKRGIPGPRRSTPSATPVSVTNAIASRSEPPATPVRDMLERQNRKAEEDKLRTSPRASLQEETAQNINQASLSTSDDKFNRFYSSFGNIISAISAPLAFTSLPLSPTPPTPAADPHPPAKKDPKPPSKSTGRTQSPEASRTVKSSEPDLAALISKPALRALQEGNTPHFATTESFFLVPTSGGTKSYANILQNPNNLPHLHHAAQNPHLDPITENDNESSGLRGSSHEEFVDARETVLPPSPTASRRPRSRGKPTPSVVASARTLAAGRGAGQKTVEEYELQIETLLQTVDKQSKRIAMWETTSQSSHIALAQSFRARIPNLPASTSDPSALAHALSQGSNAVLPTSPSPPALAHPSSSSSPSTTTNTPTRTTTAAAAAATAVQPDPETAHRIATLESQLALQAQQISSLTTEKQQLTRQNEKNAIVLGRYREQWEKLKAGARKKQQERSERRVVEMKAGASSPAARDSDSGPGNVEDEEAEAEAEGEGVERERERNKGDEEEVVEEPGFGKA